MAPSSFWMKGDRGGQVDWGDSNLTDEGLEKKCEEQLPKIFEKMRTASEDGNAECALILSGNQLQGAAALASTLHKFRLNHVRISTLRLHKNLLGDEAMEALVEHIENAAEDGQPLMELHLSNNKITEVGIRALVEAAHRCGVYFGKRDKRPDGREDRRHAALWLRTENQRPAISDPQGVLDRLEADGFPVCLLPSKEWQPPAGKGQAAKTRLDAAVHMHHSFVRRDRRANEEWEDREPPREKSERMKGEKGEKGKGSHHTGDDDWRNSRRDDDWRTSEKGKGKGGMDTRGSGKNGREEEWRFGDGKGSKGGNGKGKGYEKDGKGDRNGNDKADAWYWYSSDNQGPGWKNMWHSEKRVQDNKGSWKGWGYNDWDNNWDDDEDDDIPEPPPRLPEDSRRSRDRDREDRFQPEQRRSRWDQGWDQQEAARPSSDAYSSHTRERQGGSQRPQPQPPQPPGQLQQWQQNAVTSYSSSAVRPGFISDISGSPWLAAAAQSVYSKLKECQMLDMLKRSLNPGRVDDREWQQVAAMGASGMAAACMQRSSVVVGSFVVIDGLQELNCACAGQAGLTAVFRHLQLHRMFPPNFVQEGRDDHKCASIVAAIYGDLIDVPMEGESSARENARRVADWALLDFIFLLGITRLSFGYQASPSDVYRDGVTGEY